MSAWDELVDEAADMSQAMSERAEELRQESIIASACAAMAEAICERWPADRDERWRPILETAIRQAVEHEIAAITRQAWEED
jgi:hypothetical protein